MRNSNVRTFTAGIVAGAVITVATVAAASPAHADATLNEQQMSYVIVNENAICSAIASNPSVQGIYNVGLAITEDGFTYREAGGIIGFAVVDGCPSQLPALKRFIDFATGNGNQTA